MSDDLIRETIECLKKTYTVADKTEREAAENRLKELEANIAHHFKIILSALKDDTLVKNEMKISIILYLRKAVKNQIQKKTLGKENAIEILKCYIDTILTTALSDVCLQNLTLSLQDVLNFKVVSDNKQIVNDLVLLLQNFLEKNVGDNIQAYKSIILIIENILLSSSVGTTNARTCIGQLFTCIDFILKSIFEKLNTFDIKSNIQGFLIIVDIWKLIFNFLYTSVMKFRSRLNMIKDVLDLYSNKYIPIAVQIVILTIPGVLENNFIAWSGNSDFDNGINSMKAKAMQFINSIVSQYSKQQKMVDDLRIKVFSSLIETSVSNLEFVVSNKFNYIQGMDKESIDCPDYNYENLLYQLVLFLSKILIKEPFMESFNNFSKKFITGIIIPLLVSRKSELEQLREEGEEYSQYINDIIDENKSKTIKSQCAFLLQNMCDKYDGLSGFVVSFCLQIIDFNLKGRNVDLLPNYPSLQNDTTLFNLTSDELQVETALLIFSILTSQILKNNSLQEMFSKFIDANLQALLTAPSMLIKDRMCLLIGIFIDIIYTPENEKFSLCVEYLFLNLFLYKESSGVAHKAADALNDIVSIKKFSEGLKDLIGKYLPKLIEHIKDIKIGLYFDVLLEIVLHVDVSDFVLPLMKELVSRILKEVAPHTRIKFKVTKENSAENKARDTQYNIIVNKSLNIVRTLVDKVEYMQPYFLQFEEILTPLFEYMKNPTRIDFDEDIILILTSFIKNLKTIPQSALKVLPELPKYLKKCKGLLLDLYELMNEFIVYGNGVIDVNEDYNKIVMKIFRASFDKKSDYERSAFLGGNLMQVWLQNSKEIPQNLVKEIIQIAIAQIKTIFSMYTKKDELENSDDCYLFLSLIVLIYCGFINYPNITFEAIISNNDVHNLITWSELLIDLKLFSTYHMKAIIIGICSIFKNNELLNQIPELVTKFLNFLLLILDQQKREESKTLKTALKSEVFCNFIDSDEEADDEEDDERQPSNIKIDNLNKIISGDVEKIYKKFDMDEYSGYSNEREIKDICDRTINPLKLVDEYEYFKNCLDYLKEHNPQMFNQWVNSISDKQRELLSNLYSTKRITVSSGTFETDVPRKIIKLKRNKPENNQNP